MRDGYSYHFRLSLESSIADGRLSGVVGFLAGLLSVQSNGQQMNIKTSQSDQATHITLVDPLMHRHRIELDISQYSMVCIENVENFHLFQIQLLWHRHHCGLEQWASHSDIAASPRTERR